MSALHPASLAVCYLLMTVGSSIVMSIPPVLLLRYLYRRMRSESNSVPVLATHVSFTNSGQLQNGAAHSTRGAYTANNLSRLLGSITSMNEAQQQAQPGGDIKSQTEYGA